LRLITEYSIPSNSIVFTLYLANRMNVIPFVNTEANEHIVSPGRRKPGRSDDVVGFADNRGKLHVNHSFIPYYPLNTKTLGEKL